jgi:hypothetical protein
MSLVGGDPGVPMSHAAIGPPRLWPPRAPTLRRLLPARPPPAPPSPTAVGFRARRGLRGQIPCPSRPGPTLGHCCRDLSRELRRELHAPLVSAVVASASRRDRCSLHTTAAGPPCRSRASRERCYVACDGKRSVATYLLVVREEDQGYLIICHPRHSFKNPF